MVHHPIPSDLKMWWPSRFFMKNWWPSLMDHHWWTIIVISGSNLIFVLFLSFKYHQTLKSFGFCGKRCQGQLNSTNFTQSLIKLKRNLIQKWEIHIILFSEWWEGELPLVRQYLIYYITKISTYLHKMNFCGFFYNIKVGHL